MIGGKKPNILSSFVVVVVVQKCNVVRGHRGRVLPPHAQCFWQEPRQRAHKNVSHTGCWQAHVPGGTRSLLQYPGIFPSDPPPGQRVGLGSSLELQQQFERTRDSVSTGHLSYYQVSGVTLSWATHIWGHLVTPQANTLSSTKKGFRYNNPESSSECERCQAPGHWLLPMQHLLMRSLFNLHVYAHP
uniref:Uncharacterized protein n=1 Tax=Myotis myotis TaxID=51298 RepID=A0A7J7SRK2_MYOMY|nr:hypothetical protein mMyoMyo1_009401 [Myotis myotis]